VFLAKNPASEAAGYNNSVASEQNMMLSRMMSREPDGF
jgi:hypothetical protein